MKKLTFAFALCITATGYTQSLREPAIYGNTGCSRLFEPRGLNFEPTFFRSALVYTGFDQVFVRTNSIYAEQFFITTKNVYSGFREMNYKFPEASVFCRMENACTKRYGFMFSIHAGGYSER